MWKVVSKTEDFGNMNIKKEGDDIKSVAAWAKIGLCSIAIAFQIYIKHL